MLTSKVDKLVSIGWGRGRGHVTVLREHYLRDDISCRYQYCPICDNSSSAAVLLGDANHYIIPDGETLCQYQEVFEHPTLTGIILTQTAANTVRDEVGRQSYRSLIKSLSDPKKSSAIFDNEHQLECFSPRKQWMNGERDFTWLPSSGTYINHLVMAGADHIRIILIMTDVKDYKSQLSSGCYGNIDVTPLPLYIASKWCSHISSLPGLYESLMAAREAKMADQGSSEGFSEHVSLEEIRRGVVLGKYVTGSLRVSQYHPQEKAYVTPLHLDILEGTSASDILIPEISLRNRAIQGDSVAVELLPRGQWKGRSKALPSGNAPKPSSHDQSCDRAAVLSTGRVVAIINRNNRDIMATFPIFYDEDMTSPTLYQALPTKLLTMLEGHGLQASLMCEF